MNKKTIHLALENLEFDTVNTPRMGRALAECIEEILPKLSDMDAKVIEKHKGNIRFLRQCGAFLAPFIRNLTPFDGWSEGECISIIDQKAKCFGVIKEDL